MKILLINHYAGSDIHGMEYRPYYLAREWMNLGHEVTILAASYSHVRTRQPTFEGRWQFEEIAGIRYIWLRTPVYQGNGIRRAVNIFAFIGKALWNRDLLDAGGPWDAVIASSTYPLDMVPAAGIAKRNRAALLYEVHDLWPLSLIQLGGMSRRHPFIQLLQWGEDYAYKSADAVVSLLPKAKPYMVSRGMNPGKFHYIPNGVPIDEWQNGSAPLPEGHSNLIARLKTEGKFLIAYTGAHGIANQLESFIDAARHLEGEGIEFLLVGQGPEKEALQNRAENLGLANVHFLTTISKQAIPSLLDHMDALYIGLKDNELFKFGISPNKLMDYMMAARPVIFAIRSGNDPVTLSGCGISVPPGDSKRIADAILNLRSLPGGVRKEMGEKGRQFVIANHDYRVLAEKFLSIISDNSLKNSPEIRSPSP